MNWKNPVTFNQKIQSRKTNLSIVHANLADKVKVRDYVSIKCGEEILIPLINTFNLLREEDIESLPNSFVIKTNHGSGPEHIEIVHDKNAISAKEVTKKFNLAISSSYVGSRLGESHYDLIERKILVEKLMLNNNNAPDDYKFHIFNDNGNTRWILQIDFDRFGDHKRNLYDERLNLLDYNLNYKSGNYTLSDPGKVYEMVDIAKKLASDFNYVRVDLYLIEDNIYFGEMTFLPASGFQQFTSKDIDIVWGQYWSRNSEGNF
ncbi:ATP-grasp fold amidoligase family protein [Vibrio neonatus]|uniref:ATP-grasp fold amidoligase family protein n=1 Tax=Vibrio neonatus TaxID=278860 RepID=UPI0021C2CD79|nr:ATP-grasp fold amidoligase family protein [Vibrio neonatus]